MTTTGDEYTRGTHRPAGSQHVSETETAFYLNVEGSEACDDLKQVVPQKQVPGGHISKKILKVDVK